MGETGTYDFPGKLHQIFKEELIPILLKLFQKNKEETHPDLFSEPTCILLQKPDKNLTKNK